VDYNPYAAPQAPPPPAPGQLVEGAPQEWTASEALSFAWTRFKDVWPPLVGAYVLTWLSGLVIGQIPNVIKLSMPDLSRWTMLAVSLGGVFVSVGVAVFLNVGFTRMFLVAARGGRPPLGLLFSGADRFFPALGCGVLSVLIVGGGFGVGLVPGLILGLGLGPRLLLAGVIGVVPGIIFGLGLAFANFYVIDTTLGPVQALRASWAATRGQTGEVFVLGLLASILAIAGFALCCLGWFATLPLGVLTVAVAFTRASGRMSAQAAPPAALVAGGVSD
jgi:hypothetical protein